MVLGVVVDAVAQPRVHLRAAGALAARERLGDLLLELERVQARDLARRAGPTGTGTLRGAPWTSRRGSSFQARQNGVKTAYGFGLPMSATKLPGVRRGSTPASRSAASTRLSRAIANGETSEAK